MKNSERKKQAGAEFQDSCATILDKLEPEQQARLDKYNRRKRGRRLKDMPKQTDWWNQP